MDAACPCYVGKEDQNYYKLSNSDTIEVDSYLEGFPYPSFDAFTYLMLNKRDYLSEDEKLLFWDQIAFTNYIQHYWPNGYTPPYEDNESLFDADYEAFKEVLTELRPQIVIVWNKAIKDCLLSNGDLQFVGMINIPIISTYMFIYEGAEPELSPKQLEKLKKEYNIISEKIETKWRRELLIELFRAGETLPIHEFHHWDSTANGTAFTACKNEKMQWECGYANENFYAGFPHLYWAGTPLPGRFVRAAERYSKTKG